MVLIPRVPTQQNVLCSHDETSGTAEAGAIVYLSGDKKVAKIAASGNVPFGMLGQRVKDPSCGVPAGYELPGEIGMSDARIGDQVLVHMAGIFQTTHYSLVGGVVAGSPLYANIGDGKLTATAASGALGHDSQPKVCAIAQNTLSVDQAAASKPLIVNLAL